MLGYPTHFGQVECLKLIAGASFPEKRIGYLGLMLLLDEKQEVLMLVTNSLKNDLNHRSHYIVGLALCTLGNISSAEMARDLAGEVEKLLASSNPYVRKKACLCAIRICQRCPDLIDGFAEKGKILLSDRNHGVLLSALTMCQVLCELDPATTEKFRSSATPLVRTLKSLLLSGYVPEYDVSGITDPFLQVRILRFLRILGTGNRNVSEVMNDILAQVATNTETNRTAGCAILYEAVMTIMSIESESGLRILAINILGRFLSNRDNNLRYVALHTLAVVVNADMQAVQRHRNTIVDCLKDPDISIRRRALDLVYLLINKSNVRMLVRELINYLVLTDVEFKPDLTAKICIAVERYAPNKRWQVDTVVRVLFLAGMYMTEDIPESLILLIANTPEMYAYSVQKLYMVLIDDIYQQNLARVACWCIGEYGELLVNPPEGEAADPSVRITEEDVMDLFSRILKATTTTELTKLYILNALAKLSVRFSEKAAQNAVKMLQTYQGSTSLEVQQRSCEYVQLFKAATIRMGVLERMPVMDEAQMEKSALAGALSKPVDSEERNGADNETDPGAGEVDLLGDLPLSTPQHAAAPAAAVQNNNTTSNSNNLLDLLDMNESAPVAVPAKPAGAPVDLLADLLGDMSTTPAMSAPAPPAAVPVPTPTPAMAPSASASSPAGFDPLQAYNKHGLSIVFDIMKMPSNPSLTQLTANFANATSFPLTDVSLQVAVPKYLKLQLLPASSSVVPPMTNNVVTQIVRLANSAHGQKPLLLRIKVDFVVNGQQITDTAEVANFPEGV
jgi:AP-1 complex subunit gamma-1